MSQIAIKAGQILHSMNQFIVDRIQTAGASNLNIPQERIFELGNYQSVGIVRDVPDLTFTLDCLDVDTEVESLLVGNADPGTDALGTDGLTGTRYKFNNAQPVDIVSPLKSGEPNFDIVRGVAVPHLTLESASYRYGLRENAGENFSLRGDAIFYIPGTPRIMTATATAAQTAFPFTFNATPENALLYEEQGQSLYALNVSVNGVRQVPGSDYTETTAGITFNTGLETGDKVRIVYGTATAETQGQAVHQGLNVKPAAIRGKDIQVYVGDDVGDGSGDPLRWSDVQSFNVDWRVSLEDDYEFGNPRAVARDYTDVPEVSGSIELKPQTLARLFAKIQQMTGVDPANIVGPQSSVQLPVEIRLMNPDSGGTTAQPAGTVLKSLYVPDARFTLPGFEGRVQQKYVTTVNFESDSGSLEVYKGLRF